MWSTQDHEMNKIHNVNSAAINFFTIFFFTFKWKIEM